MEIDDNVLELAKSRKGKRSRLTMLQEEAQELAVALHKLLNRSDKEKKFFENVVKEIADVKICIHDFERMYPEQVEVIQKEIDFKINRLSERMKNNLDD